MCLDKLLNLSELSFPHCWAPITGLLRASDTETGEAGRAMGPRGVKAFQNPAGAGPGIDGRGLGDEGRGQL